MKKFIFASMLVLFNLQIGLCAIKPGNCPEINPDINICVKFPLCSQYPSCPCSDGTAYYCNCDTSHYADGSICSPCKTCSDCISDSNYISSGIIGHEKKTTKSCGCSTGTCNSSTAYRCAAGYTGTTSDGTSGCTPCGLAEFYTDSSLTNLARGTSPAGNGQSCYIVAGTYYDSMGSFTITGPDCVQ